ncbi:MAG: hypothetical protein QXO76_08630 [Thermoproteota archaeon]
MYDVHGHGQRCIPIGLDGKNGVKAPRDEEYEHKSLQQAKDENAAVQRIPPQQMFLNR